MSQFIRPCPGPADVQLPPTRIVVPEGAVDCHAHVIGLPPQYPFVETRSYDPPEATIEQYIAMLDATGMQYGVLVQVSVHGSDNRLLLEALHSYPKRLAGIAVVPLGLTEKQYVALKDAGIVGLRLNVLYGGGIGFEHVEFYIDLAKDTGWHLEFLIGVDDLPSLVPRIKNISIPYVIDHWEHFPVNRSLLDPSFQTMLSMLRDGGWVKLSGAYRNSVEGFPYLDTIPFVRQIHQAAPDRCVYGSDWPHVSHWKHMMNVGDLLNLMADWAPDVKDRHKVFVENPHKLYQFPKY